MTDSDDSDIRDASPDRDILALPHVDALVEQLTAAVKEAGAVGLVVGVVSIPNDEPDVAILGRNDTSVDWVFDGKPMSSGVGIFTMVAQACASKAEELEREGDPKPPVEN